MWLISFSMTCGAVPNAARPVANVLRRSCKTQSLTPLSLSSSALPFDQPLNGVFNLRRAGKINPVWSVDDVLIMEAVRAPNGNVCSRPFFVRFGGSVHCALEKYSERRAETSPRRWPVKINNFTITPKFPHWSDAIHTAFSSSSVSTREREGVCRGERPITGLSAVSYTHLTLPTNRE